MHRRSELLQLLQEVSTVCKTRNQLNSRQVQVADTPGPKWEGGGHAGSFLPLWAVPDPLGVEQAATGRYHVSYGGTGELRHRCAPAVGRENASVRDGGRRRRSSQTPGCNGQDMVKVRQGKPDKREANGRREESR